MLTNSLKISDTTKTYFFDLIFFKSVKKNMRKIVPCWFKQSFKRFNMLTANQCSNTGFFRHLSNPACSIPYFQIEITTLTHLFFQSIPKFMHIPIMQKKIWKIFFDFEIIAFQLVALDTHFYWERVLVIECEYVNKKSQDFWYY